MAFQMHLSDYSFDLPDGLIAQEPLERRESSRMLVVDRTAEAFAESKFSDLPALMEPGDLMVVNNTKVFPARLLGRSDTGGEVELFLVEELEPLFWETLARPGRRLKPGKIVTFNEKLQAEIVQKRDDGRVLVRFDSRGEFDEIIEEIGRTPLPPYIERSRVGPDADRERYQTVFAANRGAIAAPTAGLHFTPQIFNALNDRGVEAAEITLHVGYGTFEPVRAADLKSHRVAPERYEIGAAAAEKLDKARREGRRIVAVGTTTTRTLEYVLERFGEFRSGSGRADLTILPGYRFAAVGAMLTNFHLPESSLLILVATFGGYELIMEAYRHAVASRFRFYSYGDCMLIR